jgi:hypothetical protein
MLDCRVEEIVVRHLTHHHTEEVYEGTLEDLDAEQLARTLHLPEEQVRRVFLGLHGRPWPYRPVSMDRCAILPHFQVVGVG